MKYDLLLNELLVIRNRYIELGCQVQNYHLDLECLLTDKWVLLS